MTNFIQNCLMAGIISMALSNNASADEIMICLADRNDRGTVTFRDCPLQGLTNRDLYQYGWNVIAIDQYGASLKYKLLKISSPMDDALGDIFGHNSDY